LYTTVNHLPHSEKTLLSGSPKASFFSSQLHVNFEKHTQLPCWNL